MVVAEKLDNVEREKPKDLHIVKSENPYDLLYDWVEKCESFSVDDYRYWDFG